MKDFEFDFNNLTPEDFDNMSKEQLDEYSEWFEETNEYWLKPMREDFKKNVKADKTIVVNPLKLAKADYLLKMLKEYYSEYEEGNTEITTSGDPHLFKEFTIEVRTDAFGGEIQKIMKLINVCDEFYVYGQDAPDRIWLNFVFTNFYYVSFDKKMK